MDKIIQLQKYNQSKDNIKRIEPFVEIVNEYVALAKRYADCFEELYGKAMQNEYRREYAKGGQVIHRGFYSPSSLDVVTGGCSRGHLLKNIHPKRGYDYEYFFDKLGNMICCKHHKCTEILIYNDDCILGLEFCHSDDCSIKRISQCWYEDTKLVKYVCGLLDNCEDGDVCTEINMETFEYADNVLNKFNWLRYSPGIKLLTHNEISLFRDAVGNLLEYSVKEFVLPRSKETPSFLEFKYSAREKRKLFHDTHCISKQKTV